ncbi:MAG: SAM-dependent methyltransferase [Pelagibacteraceae bacterium]|jgi:malonyl-ACP O-methyltransferase BioC|nr:SAM-dependent methyltransferase [Pelagibacteraceae bacterium]|tara:strand:- start:941 stop:1846 length:906 start_codon:yes stop_codon:yes gene_type:complete
MVNNIKIFSKKKNQISRNRASTKYKKYDYLFNEVNKRLFDRLKFIKRKFINTLEVGSKTGNTIGLFNKKKDIKKIFISDISKEMLLIAKKQKINKQKFFLSIDEENLPFKNNQFNLVFSNLYLHWSNDLFKVLNEIYRTLKPDGLFLCSIFGSETLNELKYSLCSAEDKISKNISPRVSPFIRLQDAGTLLQKAGFQLPVIDRDSIKIFYHDIFSLMKDLKGMGESNSLINRKKIFTTKKLFDVANKIYKKKFSENKKIYATFEILYFIGWSKHSSQQNPEIPGSAKKRLADALSSKEHDL